VRHHQEDLVGVALGQRLQHRGRIGVPEGLLEVTVSLEPERAVGGVLRPGSSVAVLASFKPFDVSSEEPVRLDGRLIPKDGQTPNSTHLILHKILVTNVQSQKTFKATAKDEDATAPAPGENLLVTLAVDASQAERVVFAAEHGTVWLAVEPKDAPESGTLVQTRGTIYQTDLR
jgi:pilus assembly protein CpaB